MLPFENACILGNLDIVQFIATNCVSPSHDYTQNNSNECLYYTGLTQLGKQGHIECFLWLLRDLERVSKSKYNENTPDCVSWCLHSDNPAEMLAPILATLSPDLLHNSCDKLYSNIQACISSQNVDKWMPVCDLLAQTCPTYYNTTYNATDRTVTFSTVVKI